MDWFYMILPSIFGLDYLKIPRIENMGDFLGMDSRMKTKLEKLTGDLADCSEQLMDKHGEGVLEGGFSHGWFPQVVVMI